MCPHPLSNLTPFILFRMESHLEQASGSWHGDTCLSGAGRLMILPMCMAQCHELHKQYTCVFALLERLRSFGQAETVWLL